MQTFTYRLVEITYRNRTEWEDGHGSLQNIVSSLSEKVIGIWENMDEEFGECLVRDGDPTLVLLPDSLDGWIEYSYRLERRSTAGTEWRLVGFLRSNCRDEWDTGPYSGDHFGEVVRVTGEDVREISDLLDQLTEDKASHSLIPDDEWFLDDDPDWAALEEADRKEEEQSREQWRKICLEVIFEFRIFSRAWWPFVFDYFKILLLRRC